MISVAILNENCAPERAHVTDAGLDLKAAEETLLMPGEVKAISCGIKVEIPIGYFGMIAPRSGLGTKKGIVLANTIGIIDSDYRGEIICFMKNTGTAPYTINQFERIAQLIVIPCVIGNYWEVAEHELSNTDRGEGGFGHTG